MPTGLEKAKKYLANKNYIFKYVSGKSSKRILHFKCDKDHFQAHKLEAFKPTSRCKQCFLHPEAKCLKLCKKLGLTFVKYEKGSKVHWLCPKGHPGSSILVNLESHGAWQCKTCVVPLDIRASNKLKQKGFIYIRTTQDKFKDKILEFHCNNGHLNKVSLKSFLRNSGECIYCNPNRTTDWNQRNLDLKLKLTKHVHEIGGKVLQISVDIQNKKVHLSWKCKRNHINECHNHSSYSFLKSKGCKKCVIYDYVKPKAKHSWHDVHQICQKSELRPVNLPLTNDLVSRTKDKIWEFECFCGRIFICRLNSIINGTTRSCGCIKSWSQKEIYKYIESLGFITNYNDRDVLNGLELDIYIPERRIAFEYNGLRWHSEGFCDKTSPGWGKRHTRIKLEKCRELGIRLYVVFEDEWVKNTNVCKTWIESILTKSNSAIITTNIEDPWGKIVVDLNEYKSKNTSKNLIITSDNRWNCDDVFIENGFFKLDEHEQIHWYWKGRDLVRHYGPNFVGSWEDKIWDLGFTKWKLAG